MKANPGKRHLLLSTKSSEVVSIDGIQIKSRNSIRNCHGLRAKL